MVTQPDHDSASLDPTGVAEWFRRRMLRDSARPALSFEGETLSYGAMQQRIERLSAVLVAGGLHAGDRVAFLGVNHSLIPVALFAAARIGAIFVPLNFRLSAAELSAIIRDAGVHTLIADDASAALIEPARSELPCLRYLKLGAERGGWTLLAALMEAATEPPDAVPGRPDDVVMLMYTSGTTGKPKGVTISSGNLWSANLNTVLVTGLDHRDTSLICAPLFHAAAFCVLLLPSLMVGAHVILQRGFDAGGLLDALERHRVTLTMLVPAMMLFVSQHERFRGTDLSSMRLVIAGGAPVPEPLLQTYSARGVPVSQCYGMTESTAIATGLDAGKAIAKLGSCGRAAPLTEVRLIDGQGRDIVEPQVRGEVCLRGDHMTRGYWNRPEETAVAFTDGWFRTGDVAWQDAEGFLTICDRLKDMIIGGGENIYPAEVEGVLYAHPAIAEVAVVGAPDERWGERVVAVTVLKPGTSLTLEELRTFAETSLARYKLPSELHLIDLMPRNSTGKLLKTELRRRFSAPQVDVPGDAA